ncbi:MAG: ABC transporter permease [Paracoccaceae bacterium]|nr:ABC transporter permease [Paracoccaceae bacterium]
MILSARIALASLWHERIHLFCNVAILAGALVPLLVLFGVKSGIYRALLDDLLSDPNLLHVTTQGDNAFSEDDRAEIAGWPEAAFVALKTRAISDNALIQRPGGDRIAQATLVPSGPGDPLLSDGAKVSEGQVAVSRRLSEQLTIESGAGIRIVARSERRGPLLLDATVVDILEPDEMKGYAVLMTPVEMDLIEAYYDGYALPEFGLAEGRPLAERTTSFEGLRLYARGLRDVAALEARIQDRFGVRTHSRALDIEGVLALGRNLDLAFLLIASTAVVGLGAALLFSFWAEVDRKRRVLATLMLVGLRRREIALVPLVQAFAIGVAGILGAFVLFWAAAFIADAMFADRMPGGKSVIELSALAALLAVLLPLAIVLAAALFAVRTALGIDPAITLRTR